MYLYIFAILTTVITWASIVLVTLMFVTVKRNEMLTGVKGLKDRKIVYS